MLDPRGVRFGAGLTTAVLAIILLTTPSPLAAILLSAQTLIFATSAILGPGYSPYAWLFATAVRPRLGAPKELEDPAPPQFAQGVGLSFALAASASMLFGFTVGVWIFAGAALFAAFLNAAFGFCLGCEIYLRVRTFWPHDLLVSEADVELNAAPVAPLDSMVDVSDHVSDRPSRTAQI